jgi:hypothetical protein
MGLPNTSIKYSRAITRVRCIKETDVSRTISVLIIKDVMTYDDVQLLARADTVVANIISV